MRGEASADGKTVQRRVLVTACQYIVGGQKDGGGNSATFCLNATVPILVGVLADTQLCRLASCLKDPRIMTIDGMFNGVSLPNISSYRENWLGNTSKWTWGPRPYQTFESIMSNLGQGGVDGTDLTLSNGQQLCTLCPELCFGGRLSDSNNLIYIEGYPEWDIVSGNLIDSLNFTGGWVVTW